MKNRGKVAVSLRQELLDDIERMRMRTGESRSAVFERALEAYLGAASEAANARRYVDAYRRHPEQTGEQRSALAIALEALAAERWDA